MKLHLDTHIAVWLATDESGRLPEPLRRLLRSPDRASLGISPMVRLELTFLHELGRIERPAHEVLAALGSLSLREDDTPSPLVVNEAIASGRLWPTRDPFDRIIMSTAIASGAKLITKDRALRRAFPQHTLWDEQEQ